MHEEPDWYLSFQKASAATRSREEKRSQWWRCGLKSISSFRASPKQVEVKICLAPIFFSLAISCMLPAFKPWRPWCVRAWLGSKQSHRWGMSAASLIDYQRTRLGRLMSFFLTTKCYNGITHRATEWLIISPSLQYLYIFCSWSI